MKYVVIILLAILATSCGTLPFNIPNNYVLKPESKRGLAVFSVSEGCPSRMSIMHRKVGSIVQEAIAIDASKALRPAPIQWDNPCGRVIMRELKAGDYEFSSFVLVPLVPSVNYVKPADFPLVKFSVKPGSITYAGHLHFELDYDEATYTLHINDMWERDSKLLKSHAPGVDIENVEFQIEEFSDYKAGLF